MGEGGTAGLGIIPKKQFFLLLSLLLLFIVMYICFANLRASKLMSSQNPQ